MFDTPQGLNRNEMTRTYTRVKRELNRACFGSTYIKIGTIQRRLAWPLRKDDTQIREAFQILMCDTERLMKTYDHTPIDTVETSKMVH